MARTDANPPMPEFRTDYVLQEVDNDYLTRAVKPKQFIHIDQSECITCEGCVDICPWKCIFMVRNEAISEAIDTDLPGDDPSDECVFVGHWWAKHGQRELRVENQTISGEWTIAGAVNLIVSMR